MISHRSKIVALPFPTGQSSLCHVHQPCKTKAVIVTYGHNALLLVYAKSLIKDSEEEALAITGHTLGGNHLPNIL
jgi:hypothetical protein